MAGHSHSSNIRFRKDRVDAKRAKSFAKLSRMITVAAKLGGGDPDANARLRLAVDKARLVSMPKEGIERAIKKGTGEGSTGDYEEVVYEGYGPGGVALVLEILTDNRHRTAADVRMVFDKYGGNLGTTGAVAWMFERRGRFVVDAAPAEGEPMTEERLFELAVEAGAEDVEAVGDNFFVYCKATEFMEVRAELDRLAVPLVQAELAYVPTQSVGVDDPKIASKILKLIDGLEDNDDVQSVFSNEDFSAEVLEALAQE
ncbi:MAG: YebC/PmpR family DNA-binding transcriptional regulator [Planctomycetes bacterium]|nr:YebC/PmpR family DNA-binding transcriptional regulator [Planctomycetota bacterium]